MNSVFQAKKEGNPFEMSEYHGSRRLSAAQRGVRSPTHCDSHLPLEGSLGLTHAVMREGHVCDASQIDNDRTRNRHMAIQCCVSGCADGHTRLRTEATAPGRRMQILDSGSCGALIRILES